VLGPRGFSPRRKGEPGASTARLVTRTEECYAQASPQRRSCGAQGNRIIGIYPVETERGKPARSDPIVRDLLVGRKKPWETVVDVRSSVDPQITCATCE